MPVDITSLVLPLRQTRIWLQQVFGRLGKQATDQSVLLGRGEDNTPAYLPPLSREHASHLIVLASSGTGKTCLMAYLITMEIENEQFADDEST